MYRDLPIYYRDPLLVGNDAVIKPLDDLQVTESGDLAVQTGAESIVDNLLRRMHTPPQGYARWVRDGEALTILDLNYGNVAYLYLSTPLSLDDGGEIKDAIFEAAAQEQRIQVLDVQLTSFDLTGKVTVSLTYRILDNSEIFTVERNILTKVA